MHVLILDYKGFCQQVPNYNLLSSWTPHKPQGVRVTEIEIQRMTTRPLPLTLIPVPALGLLMWALIGPDVEGIPTRVRPYGEGAFLVFPKYRSNTYSLAKQRGDSVVPYPNRQVHEKGLITNAVDIHLDSRGTLWVLDSGVVRTLGKPLRKSGPRVIALDADTGEVSLGQMLGTN